MIYLYTGTPGSGKSLHMAKEIIERLMKGKDVIGNFPINENIFYSRKIRFSFKKGFSLVKVIKKKMGKFTYIENVKITVPWLVDYARKNHKRGRENQSLLCIDECQCMFNPREFSRKDRMPWNNFFSQHRKLGYNVILVTQSDRMLDRQIRSIIEYEVKHRKINNYGMACMLPVKTFISIEYWYGVRERVSTDYFIYLPRYGSFYDSYAIFDYDVFG